MPRRIWGDDVRDFVRTNYLHTSDEDLARMIAVATGRHITAAVVRNLRQRMGAVGPPSRFARKTPPDFSE